MSRSSPAAGFTLLEVLVALALVSVLVAGAAGLLITASGTIRSARSSTTATLLALQKVEQIKAAPDRMAGGTYQDFFAADGTPAPTASAAFVLRWTINPAWVSPEHISLVVEVTAVGAGRVADLQAVVGPPEGREARGNGGQP